MRNLWMMVLVGFVVFAWAGCGKKETDEKSRAQAVEEKAAQARKKADRKSVV